MHVSVMVYSLTQHGSDLARLEDEITDILRSRVSPRDLTPLS